IYMLQNRGFGTLGALHLKRFGQNPRSRFSRGGETIVARGSTAKNSILQHRGFIRAVERP
ncbi:MAG: hypothetical protein ACLSIH_08040, partial [Eggerthella lenta]